jgi:hypothetical protein
MKSLITLFFASGLTTAVIAAESAASRPGLLFREDWKENPAMTPCTQEHVANPDLVMDASRSGRSENQKSHHDKPADDPFYVWSGETESNWALSLRNTRVAMDLTGNAKIRWRAKQTGLPAASDHPEAREWQVDISDQADDDAADWRIREFNVADIVGACSISRKSRKGSGR